MILGNNVDVNSNINGIALVAGNSIRLNGTIEYGMYAGNNVDVNGTIEKDLFVAGNMINIDKEAILGRTIFAAGNDVTINTNVPGDLKVASSVTDITGITINGSAYIMSDTIKMDETTVINGTLTYMSNAKITGLETATINKTKIIEVETKEKATGLIVIGYIQKTIYKVITGFVTLIIILVFCPKIKKSLQDKKLETSDAIKTSLLGLMLLVSVPIACIMLLITVILIPLDLIALTLYMIVVYLASLFTSFIIGNKINNKLFKNNYMYLSSFIGILIISLLGLIPFIGGFVKFIVLIYGIGVSLELIKCIRNA